LRLVLHGAPIDERRRRADLIDGRCLDALSEAGFANSPVAMPMASSSTEGEAWTALVALGYKPAEVTQMLKPLAGSGGSTEELIRRALQGAVRSQ